MNYGKVIVGRGADAHRKAPELARLMNYERVAHAAKGYALVLPAVTSGPVQRLEEIVSHWRVCAAFRVSCYRLVRLAESLNGDVVLSLDPESRITARVTARLVRPS